MHYRLILLLVASVAFPLSAVKGATALGIPEDPSKFHVSLPIGQSNMAGHGGIAAGDPYVAGDMDPVSGQWTTDFKMWTEIAPVSVSDHRTDPNDLEIRIPLTEAADGKLFGRLVVTQL